MSEMNQMSERDEATGGVGTPPAGSAPGPAAPTPNRYGTAWNLEISVGHRPSGAPLRYTAHAMDRVLSRRLPLLPHLPEDARLADRDRDASVYKIPAGAGGYFLVVSDDGAVITAFGKTDTEWERWREAKARFRNAEARGVRPGPGADGDDRWERWEPFRDPVYLCARRAALSPPGPLSRRAVERRRGNTGNPRSRGLGC
jgi:hypothetical protein